MGYSGDQMIAYTHSAKLLFNLQGKAVSFYKKKKGSCDFRSLVLEKLPCSFWSKFKWGSSGATVRVEKDEYQMICSVFRSRNMVHG